jgi:hypothetical protein
VVAKAEKRFLLKHDVLLLEQVLVQALITAGWQSSLMSRHKITTRPMAKAINNGGIAFDGIFSAILTWDDHPDRIDVLAVVSESRSNEAVMAACFDLCNVIVAAIPETCFLGAGGNSRHS